MTQQYFRTTYALKNTTSPHHGGSVTHSKAFVFSHSDKVVALKLKEAVRICCLQKACCSKGKRNTQTVITRAAKQWRSWRRKWKPFEVPVSAPDWLEWKAPTTLIGKCQICKKHHVGDWQIGSPLNPLSLAGPNFHPNLTERWRMTSSEILEGGFAFFTFNWLPS